MKRISIFFIILAMFAWFAGCGGGGSGGNDATGEPSISSPDDTPADGDTSSTDGTGSADDDIVLPPPPASVPDKVLIVGSLVDAEGTAMPGVTITFHSDPVEATTDDGGIFQAVLDVGGHAFEFTTTTLGNIAGRITVTATDLVNEAGQRVGNFVTDSIDDTICLNLRLIDLGHTVGGNTALKILEGIFGNEIDSQGSNQTAIMTGNSEMTVNISLDGRISNIWFPTVGAYDHVPYLSDVDDWVKPFQGSFGGVKRGDDFYWFTDRNYWSAPVIGHQAGTFAPIAEITYTGKGDCSGATIKEKIYVIYDTYVGSGGRSNVFIRDFQVTSATTLSMLCRTTENAAFSPELAVYARYNPSSRHQLFHQWVPEIIDPECVSDRMKWVQPSTSHYTIMTEAITSTGSKLAMSCNDIITSEDATIIDPTATCAPLSVKGMIAQWAFPSTRRVIVSTAGCGLSGAPCSYALDRVETGIGTAESTTRTRWNSWLTGIETVANTTWQSRYKRWLVSMKMLADRNTGAIIAAASQEPTYYCSWPRDGIFQSIALIMAGKLQEPAAFFNYLFKTSQSSDGGWTQAHSSLDGSPLGLPSFPSRFNVEEDQPPTVLWGLWAYWKKAGALPSGITVTDIKEVADYVVDRICSDSGLIWPSIDRLENPYQHTGQSLYTNAAAYAGLLAAAEMVEGTDAASAATYRSSALAIKHAIEGLLCTDTMCHTRIKYEPYYIPDLDDPVKACGHCFDELKYVDIENEYAMGFEWPFHLFALGDPRVQSYYRSTKATHNDIGAFTNTYSLWVPRYLMSYLYAREAYANSEVPSGSFKSGLSGDISTVESDFPEFMTTVDYLMDQYVGGYEAQIYGPEYDGYDLGSSARPLGWSQAMGILTALAREGKRVPMIEEPVPTTECAIGSGSCCDATGNFKPSDDSCSTSTEYGCPDGTACGADVKTRTVTRYCSGSSASCTGSTVTGSWSTTAYDDCTAVEMCVAGNPVCQSCGACVHACSTGETKCEGGRAYSCTINTSGCRVWDSGTNCGTSGYGSNYCSGGDVYHDYVTRECASGSCTSSSSQELVQTCTLGCTSGACNSDCPLRTWPNNALTAVDAGSGISLTWNHPSTGSWVHHYDIARRTGTDVPQEWDTIYTVTGDVNSYTDRTPLRGSRYGYIVFAYADCGVHARAGSTLARIDY